MSNQLLFWMNAVGATTENNIVEDVSIQVLNE